MSFYPDTAEWQKDGNWSISPGVSWCPKGNRVRIGDDVLLGNRVHIGDYVRLGEGVELGTGCTKAVALGYDSRGYALVVALQKGIPMFGAGCRWFTFLEAREHWGTHYKGTGIREYFQIMIDAAERIAALWTGEDK